MGLVTNIRLLTLLLTVIASSAWAAKAKADSSSGFEKEAAKKILQLVKKLPEDAFFFDPIFEQTADHVNIGTKYTLPDADAKTIFYARKSNDTGKDVIVLTSEEDQLPFKKQKRVYVFLRQNKKSQSKTPEYYAAVAYLRNSAKKEKGAVKIGGGSYNVELDLWDDHYMPSGSTMTLNSIFCSSSVILPCFFPDTPVVEGNGIVKAAKPYAAKEVDKASQGPTNFVVDEGDPEDAFDLYRDLDNQALAHQGRRLGRSYYSDDGNLGVVGAVGNGVSNIICSVFGGCNRRKSVPDTVEINLQVNNPSPPASYPNPYGYTAGGVYPAGAQMGMGVQMGVGVQAAPGYAVYGRRKRSAEAESSSNFPGWKTQYVAPAKGVYLEPESIPYFGFGNCPVKKVTPEDLEKATTPEQIVDYYLSVLRTDCVELLRKQVLKLISDEVLSVKDKTLSLNLKLKKANNPKFTLHETVFAQTAIEMCAFSNAYVKLLKDNGPAPTTPDGANPISRTVNTATQLGLEVLEKSRELARLHMIAMTRHGITGARYMFSKLAQDHHNLQDCADCEEDLKLNLGDRLVAQGIIQYLKYGLRTVDTKEKTNVQESFKKFYTKNKAAIEAKVNLYS